MKLQFYAKLGIRNTIDTAEHSFNTIFKDTSYKHIPQGGMKNKTPEITSDIKNKKQKQEQIHNTPAPHTNEMNSVSFVEKQKMSKLLYSV